MEIYWATIMISTLLAFASDGLVMRPRLNEGVNHLISNRGFLSNFLFALSWITLVVVTGFRSGIGTDYDDYEQFFYYVSYGGGLNDSFEPGYYLINVVISTFTNDSRFLFLFCSVFFFAFVYLAIQKMSNNVGLSIFLLSCTGFTFIFMNGMRQLMAASMVMLAVCYLLEGSKKKFVALIIIASSLHFSALACLILLAFSHLSINWKSIVAITAVAAIAVLVGAPVIIGIASLAGYADYFSFDSGYEATTGYVQIAINAVVLAFLIVGYYVGGKTNEALRFCILMQVLSLTTALLAGEVVLIQRLQYYFGFQQIVSIPLALKEMPNAGLRLLIGLMIVLIYIVYTFLTVEVLGYNEVLPYGWSL